MATPTIVASYGGSSDNCYIDPTEANSFIDATIIDNSYWTDASTANRYKALIRATQTIDGGRYRGENLYYDQALKFPRIEEGEEPFPWGQHISLTNTWNIYQTEMKRKIQHATCFQAIFILKYSGKDQHDEMISRGIMSWSQSVGGISESFNYKGLMNLCKEAADLVAPYVAGIRVTRG